jgi:NAD(P)-dependent dehydrogenase (short-subunit alcohol dehydrogenase family)
MGMQTTRRVLITGTSRGIGLEMARQFAEAGWRVHATCRQPERARELARFAAGSQDSVSIHPLDVTEPRQIEAMAAALAAAPLDLLINNAGVLGPAHQGFGHTDVDVWLYTLYVNAVAPLKLMEALAENLAAAERGLVANVSSKMGSMSANDSGGFYIYRSAKAALNAVVRSTALDLAERGILVVALHPGWVRTDMGGPGAELAPAESVARMREVLQRIGPADSGRFFDTDGTTIPW